ncbi:TPA: tail fiber assembly protein [Escherichia coli]|uniref:tail fiber assembly protein n=1 Tax=Escherichia coli TaxID=562 RepID=UPI00069B58D6|nr:tail fiber assembly protein [Escherichia coli]HCN4311927.1 tail fiber assembly protein [Escherichia coli]
MTFRMSEHSRTIKIYNLLAGTNEFIGEGDAYIPPHTGLPANSTDIAPPDIPAGFVAVFNSDEASWHLVEDHRGKTVYDVASGDALFISELGPLPENVTWLSPEGEFKKWDGEKWIKDDEAEKNAKIRDAEQRKQKIIQDVKEKTQLWQTWLALGIISDDTKEALKEWMLYAQKVEATDTSTLPVKFPEKPSC